MQKFPKSPKAPVYNPFEEPSRIAEEAGEQATGSRVSEATQSIAATEEVPPEEIVEARHRARLAQVRAEVKQMRQKKEQVEAEKELVGRREQEEQDRRPAPIEPSAPRPRGLWAGVAGLVKRLQRRVESPRGPVQ